MKTDVATQHGVFIKVAPVLTLFSTSSVPNIILWPRRSTLPNFVFGVGRTWSCLADDRVRRVVVAHTASCDNLLVRPVVVKCALIRGKEHGPSPARLFLSKPSLGSRGEMSFHVVVPGL